MKPGFIQALSRRPQGMVIAGACTAFVAIAYIPISEFYFESSMMYRRIDGYCSI